MAAMGSITERRSFGAGIMVIAGTSAGSWASASQTVVVVTKTIIVRTTPYGAWFWVCIGFFGLGALILASTFFEQKLPESWRTVDHSTRYSLWLDKTTLGIGHDAGPNQFQSSVLLRFSNVCTSAITVHRERIDVTINDLVPWGAEPEVAEMMLLPGQGKWFGSPAVGPLQFGTVLNGTVD